MLESAVGHFLIPFGVVAVIVIITLIMQDIIVIRFDVIAAIGHRQDSTTAEAQVELQGEADRWQQESATTAEAL